MNFLGLSEKGYGVRSYTPQRVEKEKRDRILQAAHAAPIATNL